MVLYNGDNVLEYTEDRNFAFKSTYKFPPNIVNPSIQSHFERSSAYLSAQVEGKQCTVLLNQVQGNCGMVYLSGFDFRWDYPTSAKTFLQWVLSLIADLGYSQVMYSATTNQECVIDILLSAGFTKLKNSEFKNKRTGSKIHMYVYNF